MVDLLLFLISIFQILLKVMIKLRKTIRMPIFVEMKNEFQDTKDLLQTISDGVHFFVKENLPDSLVLITQIFLKFLILAGLIWRLKYAVRAKG